MGLQTLQSIAFRLMILTTVLFFLSVSILSAMCLPNHVQEKSFSTGGEVAHYSESHDDDASEGMCCFEVPGYQNCAFLEGSQISAIRLPSFDFKPIQFTSSIVHLQVSTSKHKGLWFSSHRNLFIPNLSPLFFQKTSLLV